MPALKELCALAGNPVIGSRYVNKKNLEERLWTKLHQLQGVLQQGAPDGGDAVRVLEEGLQEGAPKGGDAVRVPEAGLQEGALVGKRRREEPCDERVRCYSPERKKRRLQ